MKTITIICLCCLIVLNIIINISMNDCISSSRIEAYANCESPVETERGPRLTLLCHNNDGSSYDIKCCDADPNYTDYEYCTGRKCND